AMTEKIARMTLVGPILAFLGKYAAVNPCTASGGTVVFQIFDMGELLTVSNGVSVNFLEHFFGVRFGVWSLRRVVPGKGIQSGVTRARVFASLRFQTSAQVVHEPQLAAAVARGFDGLVPELQKPLCIGECALFLRRARGRKEEHLRTDASRRHLSPENLGRVIPEGCGFGLHHVAHHEPLELGERSSLQSTVRSSYRRILAHDE